MGHEVRIGRLWNKISRTWGKIDPFRNRVSGPGVRIGQLWNRVSGP